MIKSGFDPALSPLLAACSNRLAARLGVHFPPERWPELQRAVGAAAGELGCGGVRECLAWLATAALSPSQVDILARHLTVGETYFLRQPAAFDALRERILPELIAVRRASPLRRLRVWSAGCSTGEEVYSIAITLTEILGNLDGWNVTILGSDVNPAALARAGEATYSNWSFRGAPPGFRERYFTPEGNGRYRLDRRVRERVSLVPLNLAEDRYPAVETNTNAMDVVFCRNVLMYFHPDRARAVVERLSHCLVDGGWLVVGPVETSFVASPELEAHRLSGLVAFRKTGAAQAALASTGAVPAGVPSAADLGKERSAQRASRTAAKDETPRPARAANEVEDAAARFDRGHYDEAAAILEALVARGQGGAEALFLLTRAQANRGRLDEALRRCDEAVAAAPLDPAASYLRASIQLELGQVDAACASFKRTLYLDPGCPLAHFGLGNLFARQGRGDDARRHYRHALAILDGFEPDHQLREADGIPAGRLREMIEAVLGTEVAS